MLSKPQHANLNWGTLANIQGVSTDSKFIVWDVLAGSELVDDIIGHSIYTSDAVAFIYCRSGSVMAMVNGVSQTITQGRLCILLPEVYCQFHDMSADYDARILLMRVDINRGGGSLAEAFPRLTYDSVFTINEQEQNTLLSLVEYIDASVKYPNAIHSTDIEYILASLLKMEISSLFARRNQPMKEMSLDEQMVFKFNMLLTTMAAEHRDVEWYAQQFNLPPKRFALKVKSITGKNPSDMIAAAVIQGAKHLLASTEFSSSDISEKLNFATPSFFCRYFKRYVGVTPQEWREQNPIKPKE